ncbi:hypothetical protein H5410_015148 [Solanum commersonii]|uniref:Uncharacterized protein n=1 Tax=Solanum commersonii TaxID=4109 RepID=A0A9J5ZTJ6_SOLCO|nr:hypothetical protein H5410_015148 [Solanum commersonii]
MPSKPSTDRVKMVISIQDKDGTKQFHACVKLELQNLVFCFDGDKINPNATPSSLGWRIMTALKCMKNQVVEV